MNHCVIFDNSVDYARDLRPGESQTVNFYFAYDGDGRYSIEFGLLSAEKHTNLMLQNN